MLHSEKRIEIASISQIVRDSLQLQTPVDLADVVEKLKGNLKYENYIDGFMEAKIVKENESFLIEIDEHKPVNRQRFSIAHELGHLFLHMGFLDKEYWCENNLINDSTYFRYGRGLEEREADEFAGAFLMPEEEFIELAEKVCNKYGYYDLEEIAEHFRVSTNAVEVRGVVLDIWGW